MPSKAETQRRKDEGLCITCGLEPHRKKSWRTNPRTKTKTLVPARWTCQGCSDAARARTKARRKTAKKIGVCEACMKRKRAPGKSRCKTCLKKYGNHNTAKVI